MLLFKIYIVEWSNIYILWWAFPAFCWFKFSIVPSMSEMVILRTSPTRCSAYPVLTFAVINSLMCLKKWRRKQTRWSCGAGLYFLHRGSHFIFIHCIILTRRSEICHSTNKHFGENLTHSHSRFHYSSSNGRHSLDTLDLG